MTNTEKAPEVMPRTVVSDRKVALGMKPDGVNANPTIEVEIRVIGLDYGENFLFAHYLLNQAHREVMAKVDEMALNQARV